MWALTLLAVLQAACANPCIRISYATDEIGAKTVHKSFAITAKAPEACKKNQFSTPSTRRLLDGVAMPVPRRSTEPAPDSLVDSHTGMAGPRKGICTCFHRCSGRRHMCGFLSSYELAVLVLYYSDHYVRRAASESTQNCHRDHPAPSLMETSRVDAAREPENRGNT